MEGVVIYVDAQEFWFPWDWSLPSRQTAKSETFRKMILKLWALGHDGTIIRDKRFEIFFLHNENMTNKIIVNITEVQMSLNVLN